jgi:hypothetical protein
MQEYMVAKKAKSCACKHDSKDHLRTIVKPGPGTRACRREARIARCSTGSQNASYIWGYMQVHRSMLMLSGQEQGKGGPRW